MVEAPGHPEVLKIVAPNPGPMTLEGTNTYLFGGDPCVVIDPGSDDPGDHTAGADQIEAEVVLPSGGEEHFGLRALATPGHAEDHVCFLTETGVCFSGDLVLGLGSTIVPPGGNSLAAFMDSLALLQEQEIELIAPGHGPWIKIGRASCRERVY